MNPQFHVIENEGQLDIYANNGVNPIQHDDKKRDEAVLLNLVKQQRVSQLKNLNRCLYFLQNDLNFESKRYLVNLCVQKMDKLFKELEDSTSRVEVFDSKDTADYSLVINSSSLLPLLTMSQLEEFEDMIDDEEKFEAFKKGMSQHGKASKKKPGDKSSQLCRYPIEFEESIINTGYINNLYNENTLAKNVLNGQFQVQQVGEVTFPGNIEVRTHCTGSIFATLGAIGYKGRNSHISMVYYDEQSKSFKGIFEKLEHQYEFVHVDEPNDLLWLSSSTEGIVAYKLQDFIRNAPEATKNNLFITKGTKSKPVLTGGYEEYTAMLRIQDQMVTAIDEDITIWTIPDLSQQTSTTMNKPTTEFQLDILKNNQGVQLLPYQNSLIYLRRYDGNSFHTIDLEKQCIDRIFYGHQFVLEHLSTVKDLPYLVLSTSKDGCAKLWDARQYQCIQTMRVGDKHVHSGAIAMLNSVPFVFLGGKSESIMAFDLRVGCCAYEMSTGNAEPYGLYWHDKSSTLLSLAISYHSDDTNNNWSQNARHTKDMFQQEWHAPNGGYFAYTFNQN
jgi:hypothetical protein